jgi:hypothetical protein
MISQADNERIASAIRKAEASTSGEIYCVIARLPRINGNRSTLRKLICVAHEIKQRLPQPHLVGMHRPDLAVAMDRKLIAVLGCQRFDGLDHVGDQWRKREGFDLQRSRDSDFVGAPVPICAPMRLDLNYRL